MKISKIDLLKFIFDLVRTDPGITLGAMSPITSDKVAAMSDLATAIGKQFPELGDVEVESESLTACRAVLATIESADANTITDVLWIKPPYQLEAVHETVTERLREVIAKAEGRGT